VISAIINHNNFDKQALFDIPNGYIVLHRAMHHGHQSLVDLILEKGGLDKFSDTEGNSVDQLTYTNKKGETALDIAADRQISLAAIAVEDSILADLSSLRMQLPGVPEIPQGFEIVPFGDHQIGEADRADRADDGEIEAVSDAGGDELRVSNTHTFKLRVDTINKCREGVW
jgi:hypothetical protein